MAVRARGRPVREKWLRPRRSRREWLASRGNSSKTMGAIRPRRLAWPRTLAFHASNTGSNPVGVTHRLDPPPAQGQAGVNLSLCPEEESSVGPPHPPRIPMGIPVLPLAKTA